MLNCIVRNAVIRNRVAQVKGPSQALSAPLGTCREVDSVFRTIPVVSNEYRSRSRVQRGLLKIRPVHPSSPARRARGQHEEHCCGNRNTLTHVEQTIAQTLRPLLAAEQLLCCGSFCTRLERIYTLDNQVRVRDIRNTR
jgi:hypothetical protein